MIDFNIFKIECLNLGQGLIIQSVKVIWTVVQNKSLDRFNVPI